MHVRLRNTVQQGWNVLSAGHLNFGFWKKKNKKKTLTICRSLLVFFFLFTFQAQVFFFHFFINWFFSPVLLVDLKSQHVKKKRKHLSVYFTLVLPSIAKWHFKSNLLTTRAEKPLRSLQLTSTVCSACTESSWEEEQSVQMLFLYLHTILFVWLQRNVSAWWCFRWAYSLLIRSIYASPT